MKPVTDLSGWFDRLVEFARKHRCHLSFQKMLEACRLYPVRRSVERLRKAVAGMPRGSVRSDLLRTVDAVLFGEFRGQFRFSFHTYPKVSGQVSAAGELFSLVRQAVEYHYQEERLWLRLGDSCDYEEYGQDLDAVAGMLVEARVPFPWHQRRGGITAPGYEAANYISLFWGDKDGNYIRNLSRAEVRQLVRAVEQEAAEYA